MLIYVIVRQQHRRKAKTMWKHEVIERGIDEDGRVYWVNQYGRKFIENEFSTIETLQIVNGILAAGLVMFTIMMIDALIGMI